MKQTSELKYYDPDAETAQPIATEDESEPQVTPVELTREPTRRPRWRRWLAVAVSLVFTAVVIESLLFIQQSFAQSSVLGILWSAGLGILAVVLLGFIGREWWLLRRLKRRWQQQNDGRSTEHLLHDLDHPDLTHLWQQTEQSYWSDEERVERFEIDIVSKVDQQAQRLISRQAAEAAALVAVSPSSIADMLLLLWRNQRMISKVAELYGVELGYWSRVRLWRQILANLAYAGISELAVDVGTQWLSAELMTKLSARAGQGLGAGLLTARLGYQVMGLCRPMPFTHVNKPGYWRLQKDLLSQLGSVLPTIYRSRKPTTSTTD